MSGRIRRKTRRPHGDFYFHFLTLETLYVSADTELGYFFFLNIEKKVFLGVCTIVDANMVFCLVGILCQSAEGSHSREQLDGR